MPIDFKTVAIIAKPNGQGLSSPLNILIDLLNRRGIAVRLQTRTAEPAAARTGDGAAREPLDELIDGADLAIAVGGDGTMLGVARVVARHGVPLVGINLGHLGFLTDISADAAVSTLSDLLDGKYNEEQRILLEAEIIRAGESIFRSVALNDVSIAAAGRRVMPMP